MLIAFRCDLCRHIHEDEEIRYIFEGAGYFDVRGTLHSNIVGDEMWAKS